MTFPATTRSLCRPTILFVVQPVWMPRVKAVLPAGLQLDHCFRLRVCRHAFGGVAALEEPVFRLVLCWTRGSLQAPGSLPAAREDLHGHRGRRLSVCQRAVPEGRLSVTAIDVPQQYLRGARPTAPFAKADRASDPLWPSPRLDSARTRRSTRRPVRTFAASVAPGRRVSASRK